MYGRRGEGLLCMGGEGRGNVERCNVVLLEWKEEVCVWGQCEMREEVDGILVSTKPSPVVII